MRFAEILFVGNVRRRLRDFPGGAFGRQAGGEIFGAFDFAGVAFFKNALVAALFAHHVGARLRGLAVRFLRVVAEAALGAEPHAAVAA